MQNFKFEKLFIWQKSMDFGEAINAISITFPKKEKCNLSYEIGSASNAIAFNIAESSTGQSNTDQIKCIGHSISCLAKVVTCLFKARRRSYICEEKFIELYNQAHHLLTMMTAFKKNLQ